MLTEEHKRKRVEWAKKHLNDDWKRTIEQKLLHGGVSTKKERLHTSKLAKEFIAENTTDLLGWPSNSLDLTPIENLWAIVKKNV
ncbi:hypothetical protein G9A89_001257 [Geosiphon pyriformis]|nr:hypothetical protein G9A89_001257 [Geosiphon pyriformis]